MRGTERRWTRQRPACERRPIVRVHSISCGTMCPLSSRLVNGTGGWLEPARMVCHGWLIEAPDGLVLVDTGLGTEDLVDVSGRLGWAFGAITRPDTSRASTALAQVERLGFKREDVRHLVPTHLDLDHAGGLPDFPDAEVHVFRPEHDAAMARATLRERERYRPAHFRHGPKWRVHDLAGDRWLGFDSVRALGTGDDEILLVPLQGHTRGHCGVAVRTGSGFRLHAGDAYFSHVEMDGSAPMPKALAAFEALAAIDRRLMEHNKRRLLELRAAHPNDVRVHSAHCPVELAEYAAAS